MTSTVATTDVVILLVIGLVVSIMAHKFIMTKGSGASRIGRGQGFVKDGRELMRAGRALLRKSVIYFAFALLFGLCFLRVLLRVLLA